jgi:hypothetical protein
MTNPPLKFGVPVHVKRGLQKIADYHGIGVNEPSPNGVGQQVMSVVARIPPKKYFAALAALENFCRPGKFDFAMPKKKRAHDPVQPETV